MANPHVGDVGAVIRLTSTKDLSTQTSLALYYQKPSGTKGVFTGTINGTTDVQYTTTDAGDLDESGQWTFQGYAAITGWSGRSKAVKIQVDPIILTA
jgi:hypothetical protein